MRMFAALGLAGLALAACARGPEPVCPGITIVADAGSITRFRDGPGRDLGDVVNAGEMIEARLERCRFDRGEVISEILLGVGATRGPADRSRVVEFDYFVAVADLDFNILARESFRVRFDFVDSRQRQIRLEELEPRIPARDSGAGSAYRILIGFQMTDQELAWNRSRGR